ncbi:MAG: Type 1 glutamine amidotransferase-like domain-containing protein [Candidatus Pacebacteria bacterium]|nr:Type 1 glutamine amidotransferase-like domain-containing protein [Candidatus Paceibacterota bacterium]
MKFYLSSYKIGNETDKLKAMISTNNKRTAYISNALDFSNDLERRKQSEQADIGQLNGVGLSDIEKIDLRDYFGKKAELEKKISEFGVIWVRGGNCFVLRQAMKVSGFDEILKGLLKKEGVLYGGYSAGICVLAPTLKGMELVDDPNVKPYENQKETIWEGVGILDYTIVPHYKSNHPESAKVDETVEYMGKNKIPFKSLRDGEVIIIE